MSFQDIKNSLKKGLDNLKKEVKEIDDKIAIKQKEYNLNTAINEAFVKKATEFEVLGKSGIISKKTVLAVPEFTLFKKTLLIDSDDVDKDILVGTILKTNNKEYEIKELFCDIQEYYEVEVEYENEVKKYKVPCFKAIVKEL